MSDEQRPSSSPNPEESENPSSSESAASSEIGTPPAQTPPPPSSQPTQTPIASETLPPPTPTPASTGTSGDSTGRTIAIVVGVIVVAVVAFFLLRSLFGSDEPAPGGAPTASIIITRPASGTVLDIAAPFAVEGTGAALPEGNVVVQALDGNNAVLVEAPTTIQAPDAGTGGAGPWSIQLTVSVAPGTPGRIRAFSTSPADGSLLAEAYVDVTYGASDVNTASVSIDSPAAGEVVPPGEITVTGAAVNPPDPNVAVQAVDGNNQVLTEQIVPVDADGRWQAQLQFDVASGTPGRIVAFVGSAADQSVAAQAEIPVTFGEGTVVVPAITIDIPQVDETVSPVEVVVVGTGTALPENNVVVRILDANGAVLVEQPTTVAADVGGTGEWRVTLQPNATPDTAGQIVAFSPSPADGTNVAEASVNVTFGQGTTVEPAITIDIPQVDETVSPVEVVVVGTGTALPENNVVVRILDANGAVLVEQPTTVAADVGGTGEWRITLQPNATPDTAGQIVAFSPSPADGTNVAEASVNVTFGQGTTVQPAITIDTPLADETVSPTEVVVVGTGTALPENNVVVRILDANGAVLVEQPTTVAADVGGTGEWQITLQPNATPDTAGQIVAFSPSPADGTNVAEIAIPVQFGAQ